MDSTLNPKALKTHKKKLHTNALPVSIRDAVKEINRSKDEVKNNFELTKKSQKMQRSVERRNDAGSSEFVVELNVI